jgi:transcription factor SFP1
VADSQQQNNDQLPMSCLPPALLFASSTSVTPAGTPGGSRAGSPSYGQQQQHPHQGGDRSPASARAQATPRTAPVSPSDAAPGQHGPNGSGSASAGAAGSSGAHPNHGSNAAGHQQGSSTTSLRPAASLLLSKPFRCPKPNCNKSYKQANGLKYHMTHGSCNFAPPKDLEHVKDLLERKRREREAAGGVPRSTMAGQHEPGTIGGLPSTLDTQLLSSYYDLNLSSMNITESELREVEREAEKRLRPFACGVGDCQRRYKNMNGLRYHYQHSGDHGAVGLALLASGQHECLQNGSHGRKAASHHHTSTTAHPSSASASNSAATTPLDENDARKRSVLFKSHSVSVPVSRTGSRTSTPVPIGANSANTSPKSGTANIVGHGGRQSSTSPLQAMQQVNGVGINTGMHQSSSSLSQALGNQPHSQPSSQSPSPIMNHANAAGGQYNQAQQQQMAAAAYQQYAAQMQRQYHAALQQQAAQQHQQHHHQQQQEYAMFEGSTQYPGMDMA